MIYPPGATSVSVDIQWLDDAGAVVTGKVATDFPVVKWSSGTNTADSTITISDLAAITTAHPNDNTAGGVKEREGGVYRLDLPNNMFTSAGRKSLTFAETTNKHFVVLAGPFDVQYVQTDLRQALGTAVTLDTNNTLNVSAKYLAGQTITAAAGVTFPASVGTSTLTQAQVTGGAFALGDSSGRVNVGKALDVAITLDTNNVMNVSTKYVSGSAPLLLTTNPQKGALAGTAA